MKRLCALICSVARDNCLRCRATLEPQTKGSARLQQLWARLELRGASPIGETSSAYRGWMMM